MFTVKTTGQEDPFSCFFLKTYPPPFFLPPPLIDNLVIHFLTVFAVWKKKKKKKKRKKTETRENHFNYWLFNVEMPSDIFLNDLMGWITCKVMTEWVKKKIPSQTVHLVFFL